VQRQGSAIWGGATLGLAVGLILGFFVGSSYWTTVLYAAIGAGSGLVANVLAWPGDIVRRREMKRRERARRSILEIEENALREHSPADFETTPNVEERTIGAVLTVEHQEDWRAGYDSLEAFYAAHEERHPDIRTYAARARAKLLNETEEILRANSPADFEANPDAAFDCISAAHAIVDEEYWRAGYDSLESFYTAHEARHPDIHVYAAVYREGDPERVTAEIAERR
jgi:hypothetical protein